MALLEGGQQVILILVIVIQRNSMVWKKRLKVRASGWGPDSGYLNRLSWKTRVANPDKKSRAVRVDPAT